MCGKSESGNSRVRQMRKLGKVKDVCPASGNCSHRCITATTRKKQKRYWHSNKVRR
jgi:hypothetical protein